MNKIYELPPMLSGTADNQLRQLRDYLVRLARTMPGESDEGTVTLAVKRATEISAKQTRESADIAAREAQRRAQTLKALIIKTADDITEIVDKISTYLDYNYNAVAGDADYKESIHTEIETTARGTVENYQYAEGVTLIQAIGGVAAELEAYHTELTGQIRRGVILDDGTPTLGIVISQNLTFTGHTREGPDGEIYHDLETGQTVGIYTSTGWQYWAHGQKIGWFDSEDRMLHVPQLVVESLLKLGDDWEITTTGGFGLRYIGS